jgi:hypothetical protein
MSSTLKKAEDFVELLIPQIVENNTTITKTNYDFSHYVPEKQYDEENKLIELINVKMVMDTL